MNQLEPPDTHHLSAAIGWLELGNGEEAESELNQVSAPMQHYLPVLSVRWQVLADLKKWESALDVAREIISIVPEEASGWIHQAYSLRRVRRGGLKVAWDALICVVEKFPKEAIIPYNLACYAAQMGRLNDAWEWLEKAVKIGDKKRILKMAFEDHDLEPIRDRLKALVKRAKS